MYVGSFIISIMFRCILDYSWMKELATEPKISYHSGTCIRLFGFDV